VLARAAAARSCPRFANGQEEIKLVNGGRYRIVAPTRGGARGPANDDVIVDEVRELDSFDFIAAAKPTLTASPDPQIIYLSNMGDEDSVVLTSIRCAPARIRALAYLEWSAAPERDAGDVDGWLEANPVDRPHCPGCSSTWPTSTGRTGSAGTLAIFETEHLCRSRRHPPRAARRRRALEAREVDRPIGDPIGARHGVAWIRTAAARAVAIAWRGRREDRACACSTTSRATRSTPTPWARTCATTSGGRPSPGSTR
jgi:hypothetical protein